MSKRPASSPKRSKYPVNFVKFHDGHKARRTGFGSMWVIFDDEGNRIVAFSADIPAKTIEHVWLAYELGLNKGTREGRRDLQRELRKLIGAEEA